MSSLRKYGYAFLLGFKRTLEYRLSFFLTMISCLFPMVIQYYLWTSMYAHSTDPFIFGYSYRQMILYVLLASLLTLVVSAGFEWDIASDIKEGGLNAVLVRPVSYVLYRICSFLGGKILQVLLSLAIIAVLLLFYPPIDGRLWQLRDMVLFVAALWNGVVMNMMIFYCLSMMAFWISEVWGVFAGFGVVSSLFSGGVFPIEVFGAVVNRLLDYLPFKYVVYFPVNVLTFRVTGTAVLEGIAIQLGWMALLAVLARVIWQTGTKKYVSIGG